MKQSHCFAGWLRQLCCVCMDLLGVDGRVDNSLAHKTAEHAGQRVLAELDKQACHAGAQAKRLDARDGGLAHGAGHLGQQLLDACGQGVKEWGVSKWRSGQRPAIGHMPGEADIKTGPKTLMQWIRLQELSTEMKESLFTQVQERLHS